MFGSFFAVLCSPCVHRCFFFKGTEIHHRSTRSHAAKLNRESVAGSLQKMQHTNPTRTSHSCKTLSHSLVAVRLWLSIWLFRKQIHVIIVGLCHIRVGYRTPGRYYIKDSSKEQTSKLLTSRGGLGETLYNTLRALFKRCRLQARLAHVILVRLCHIRFVQKIWLFSGFVQKITFRGIELPVVTTYVYQRLAHS